MKILLIDNGTKHLGKLKELLAGNELEILPMFQKYPPSENYDLIVLSGGSELSILSSPEVFKEESDLVKNSKTPIIGICQGFEIIAHTFGSRLVYPGHRAMGIKKIEVIDKKYFNLPSPIEVYEAHSYVVKKLGKDLVGIAKSEFGWEIIKHKEKKIFGFQFHPEMLIDKTAGDEIFKSVFDKIKR